MGRNSRECVGLEGVFNLTLGEFEPLTADSLPNALWLGIVINGGTESSPRQRVASSAFALRANEAGIAQMRMHSEVYLRKAIQPKTSLPGLCVTAEALSDALTTLSSEAPYFTAGTWRWSW